MDYYKDGEEQMNPFDKVQRIDSNDNSFLTFEETIKLLNEGFKKNNKDQIFYLTKHFVDLVKCTSVLPLDLFNMENLNQIFLGILMDDNFGIVHAQILETLSLLLSMVEYNCSPIDEPETLIFLMKFLDNKRLPLQLLLLLRGLLAMNDKATAAFIDSGALSRIVEYVTESSNDEIVNTGIVVITTALAQCSTLPRELKARASEVVPLVIDFTFHRIEGKEIYDTFDLYLIYSCLVFSEESLCAIYRVFSRRALIASFPGLDESGQVFVVRILLILIDSDDIFLIEKWDLSEMLNILAADVEEIDKKASGLVLGIVVRLSRCYVSFCRYLFECGFMGRIIELIHEGDFALKGQCLPVITAVLSHSNWNWVSDLVGMNLVEILVEYLDPDSKEFLEKVIDTFNILAQLAPNCEPLAEELVEANVYGQMQDITEDASASENVRTKAEIFLFTAPPSSKEEEI